MIETTTAVLASIERRFPASPADWPHATARALALVVVAVRNTFAFRAAFVTRRERIESETRSARCEPLQQQRPSARRSPEIATDSYFTRPLAPKQTGRRASTSSPARGSRPSLPDAPNRIAIVHAVAARSCTPGDATNSASSNTAPARGSGISRIDWAARTQTANSR